MIEIHSYVLGPVQTNAYLVMDSERDDCVVIDPAWSGEFLVEQAKLKEKRIGNIWLTHAHFDHFGGAAAVVDRSTPTPSVALHPLDQSLWRAQGGAPLFGMSMDPGPEPSVELSHGQILFVGKHKFEVRHAPGHTRGHVIFYLAEAGVAFCGDVIFNGSIGRTDLPGGNNATLLESIRTQVLTLPGETRLLSGHGPETTVQLERTTNPFLLE